MTYSAQDMEIMARTIWGEARGEEFAGKVAVGWVIRNRFEKPGWWTRNKDDIPDDTIAAACRDPWQFSCWNDKDPNRPALEAINISNTPFRECLLAVSGVLTGLCPDPTGRANHYKTSTLAWPKDWGDERDPVSIIGRHSFYRL